MLLFDSTEEAWIRESELEAQRLENENKRIRDELLEYKMDAIEETVEHFLKPGKIWKRGDPDFDDSRYFFSKQDVLEVLRKYKEKGGDERKIGYTKVPDMETAWEIYRIDTSPNAKKNEKIREARKYLRTKGGV